MIAFFRRLDAGILQIPARVLLLVGTYLLLALTVISILHSCFIRIERTILRSPAPRVRTVAEVRLR